MSAFIQAEVEAEAVVEAMNKDGQFALDMWLELAEKLHMGLLLDNACDLFRGLSAEEAAFITGQFKTLADIAMELHPGADSQEGE